MNNKIVLYGGIGNQLFQIIYGMNLIQRGQNVIFDHSLNHFLSRGQEKSEFHERLLAVCSAHQKTRDYRTLCQFMIWAGKQKISKSEEKSFECTEIGNAHFGYYQHLKFIWNLNEANRDLIRSTFFKGTGAKNMAFLHLRFGDYNKRKVRKIMTELDHEYYLQSLRYLQSEGMIESCDIFTNDRARAEIYTRKLADETGINFYFDNSDDILTIWRDMSEYKYAIIANSTFSWWPSFMGEAEIVCTPSKWYKKQRCGLYHDRTVKI